MRKSLQIQENVVYILYVDMRYKIRVEEDTYFGSNLMADDCRVIYAFDIEIIRNVCF